MADADCLQGLAEARLNVADAAALAGYASEAAFSCVFRKQVAMSPAGCRMAQDTV
jgi:AraC-like DNA-binding protein